MNLLLKVALRYSIIAISFVFFMFVIAILLDKNPLIYTNNIVYMGPLFGIFIFLLIKALKTLNGGALRFWQGFSSGALFILFFCLLYGSFLLIYGEFFDTQYYQEYRDLSVARTENQREQIIESFDLETYENTLKSTANASIFDIAFLLVRNCVFIGIVLVPIVSLFMRTTEPKVKS